VSSEAPLNKDLITAIERIGTTWRERAERLGITERWLLEWRRGYVPDIVLRLEQYGVIHVTGRCPCSQPKATEAPTPEPAAATSK
jgi:hypothetical protein